MSKLIINNPQSFDNIVVPILKELGGQGYDVTCLKIGRGMHNHKSVVRMPKGTILPFIERHIHRAVTVASTTGKLATSPRFFRHLLKLEVDGTEALAQIQGKEIYGVFDNGLGAQVLKFIMDDHEENPFFEGYFIHSDREGFLFDLVREAYVPEDCVFFRKGLDNSRRPRITYNSKELGGYQTSTPGIMKQKGILLPGVGGGMQAEEWKNIFYHMNAGGLSLLQHFRESKEFKEELRKVGVDLDKLSEKEVAQFSTRWGQFWAPSVSLKEPVRNLVIHQGKFKTKDGYEFTDGNDMISADFLCRSVNATLSAMGYDIEVTKGAVLGKTIQDRFFGVTKHSVTARADWFMRAVKAYNRHKTVTLYVSQMTEEEKFQFGLFILSKGKCGTLAGVKLSDGYDVQLLMDEDVDPSDVDAYVDFNGLKTLFDPSYMVSDDPMAVKGLRVLAWAGISSHEVSESVQVYNKYLSADSKMPAERAQLLSYLMTKKKKESLFRTEEQAPRISDILGKKAVNWSEVRDQALPEYALKHSKRAFESKANKTMESLSRTLSGLNFKVKGRHLVLLPDPAAYFDMNVLRVDEQGIADVIAGGEDGKPVNLGKGEAYKFPSQGSGEYLPYATRLTDWYMKRLDVLYPECHPAIRKVLQETVSHIGSGVLVIPAYTQLNHQLAGQDYDIDSVNCVMNGMTKSEKEEVEAACKALGISYTDVLQILLHKNPPEVVNID